MAPIATVMAALIAAFAGSLVGAWAALNRFRLERVFDRQLDWYERGLRSVSGLSEALSVALVFEKEGRGTDEFWVHVQNRHLEVLRFANEAPIYGTAAAITAANGARVRANQGAAISNIYEPRMLPEPARAEAVAALHGYPPLFDDAVLQIAAQARHHLGLEPLSTSELGGDTDRSLFHYPGHAAIR